MGIEFKDNGVCVVPAGTYWLCDPCTLVLGSHWADFCDSINSGTPVGKVAGHEILALATGCGDGEYEASIAGWTIGVDSGLIGLVPAEYVDEFNVLRDNNIAPEQHVVAFAEPTPCFSVDGVLSFGEIVVDTSGGDECDCDCGCCW